jgi:cytochrome c556
MWSKWTVLAVAMTAVGLTAAGLSFADDKKESPLEKIMEKVNAKNNLIKKAVRTPVAFKKAGKSVVKAAEDLAKLGKEAREIKSAAEKVKKPFSDWTKMMDEMIAASEKMAKAAEKGDHAEAKSAQSALTKSCGDCHKVFRVEEDEFDK